jgi:hypothetical protein
MTRHFTHRLHVWLFNICVYIISFIILVLDPRISYAGVSADYASDPHLTAYLKESVTNLRIYFKDHYLNNPAPPRCSTPPPTLAQDASQAEPAHFNFMARFQDDVDDSLKDEIDEYFKLPRESFKHCTSPIRWWFSRRSQFPNLYRLSRDILLIPGMFNLFMLLLDALY